MVPSSNPISNKADVKIWANARGSVIQELIKTSPPAPAATGIASDLMITDAPAAGEPKEARVVTLESEGRAEGESKGQEPEPEPTPVDKAMEVEALGQEQVAIPESTKEGGAVMAVESLGQPEGIKIDEALAAGVVIPEATDTAAVVRALLDGQEEQGQGKAKDVDAMGVDAVAVNGAGALVGTGAEEEGPKGHQARSESASLLAAAEQAGAHAATGAIVDAEKAAKEEEKRKQRNRDRRQRRKRSKARAATSNGRGSYPQPMPKPAPLRQHCPPAKPVAVCQPLLPSQHTWVPACDAIVAGYWVLSNGAFHPVYWADVQAQQQVQQQAEAEAQAQAAYYHQQQQHYHHYHHQQQQAAYGYTGHW
jgi:hypothetical protein